MSDHRSAILDYALSRAWALKPEVLQSMTGILLRHAGGEKLPQEEIEAVVEARDEKRRAIPEGFQVSDEGLGIIPITGVLAKHSSQVNNISAPRGTSVQQIRESLDHAASDDGVKGVLLDIDSPGGSVEGIAELADDIHGFGKPVFAMTDGTMASAAYWLGSQASGGVFATRAATVGSIGVYAPVVDDSVRAHQAGVKVDIVKAGRFKGSGHPGTAFTEDQRSALQGEVDQFYQIFTESVARGRGLSEARAQELGDGRIHIGAGAKREGLVDEIDSVRGILRTVHSRIGDEGSVVAGREHGIEWIGEGGGFTDFGADDDRTSNEPTGKEPVMIPEQIQPTLESLKNDHPELVSEIATEAIKGERERISKIRQAAFAGQEKLVDSLIEDGTEYSHALEAILEDRKKRGEEELAELKASAPPAVGQDDEGEARYRTVREDGGRKEPQTAKEAWAALEEDTRNAEYQGSFELFEFEWDREKGQVS